MPTRPIKSRIVLATLGMLGTACLMQSFAVHPQQKSDTPYAAQGKESSSGTSNPLGVNLGMGGSSSKVSNADEKMMKQLAESNLAEISAGKIAQDKAQSSEVKSFAKKMVDDHTKAMDELKQLAQSKAVTLPTEPDKQHQAMEKKLSALSGEKFDRQYMQQAGDRAHKDTHRLLERASSKAEDADLKNYASKVMGTVEGHQQLAKEASMNLKASSEGKSSGASDAGSKSQEDSSGKTGHGSTGKGGGHKRGHSSGASMPGSTGGAGATQEYAPGASGAQGGAGAAESGNQ